MKLNCVICWKEYRKKFQDPSQESLEKERNLLQKFFNFLERYLEVKENSLKSKQVETVLESLLNSKSGGVCEQCLETAEAFCTLFHDLNTIELLLNWKVWVLKEALNGGSEDQQGLTNFEARLKKRTGNGFGAQTDLLGILSSFRKKLIKNCNKKLLYSCAPKIVLQRCDEKSKRTSNTPTKRPADTQDLTGNVKKKARIDKLNSITTEQCPTGITLEGILASAPSISNHPQNSNQLQFNTGTAQALEVIIDRVLERMDKRTATSIASQSVNLNPVPPSKPVTSVEASKNDPPPPPTTQAVPNPAPGEGLVHRINELRRPSTEQPVLEPNQTVFYCAQCNKNFKYKVDLILHQKLVHATIAGPPQLPSTSSVPPLLPIPPAQSLGTATSISGVTIPITTNPQRGPPPSSYLIGTNSGYLNITPAQARLPMLNPVVNNTVRAPIFRVVAPIMSTTAAPPQQRYVATVQPQLQPTPTASTMPRNEPQSSYSINYHPVQCIPGLIPAATVTSSSYGNQSSLAGTDRNFQRVWTPPTQLSNDALRYPNQTGSNVLMALTRPVSAQPPQPSANQQVNYNLGALATSTALHWPIHPGGLYFQGTQLVPPTQIIPPRAPNPNIPNLQPLPQQSPIQPVNYSNGAPRPAKPAPPPLNPLQNQTAQVNTVPPGVANQNVASNPPTSSREYVFHNYSSAAPATSTAPNPPTSSRSTIIHPVNYSSAATSTAPNPPLMQNQINQIITSYMQNPGVPNQNTVPSLSSNSSQQDTTPVNVANPPQSKAYFQCKDCGQTCKSGPGLRYLHTIKECPGRAQNEKDTSFPFPCDKCEERFRYNFSLKEHKRVVHDGVQLQCGYCSEYFNYSSGLSRHIKINHKDNNGVPFPYKFVLLNINEIRNGNTLESEATFSEDTSADNSGFLDEEEESEEMINLSELSMGSGAEVKVLPGPVVSLLR